MKTIHIHRYVLEEACSEKDFDKILERIQDVHRTSNRAHVVSILSALTHVWKYLKKQVHFSDAYASPMGEMILRGATRQVSATILYQRMIEHGLDPLLLDVSRVASGLGSENIKPRVKRLAASAIKRKVGKAKNSVVYINRSAKIKASGLRYLDSDYFAITLASALGVHSCDFFLDIKNVMEELKKIRVVKDGALTLSYLEATEIADLIHDKGITADLIRYAKERKVMLSLKDIETGKPLITIKDNKEIAKGVVKYIRPLTQLAKIHLKWNVEAEYDPALILSNLSEAKINLFHLHYAFLEKPRGEMSFFVHKEDLESLSMILEYHKKEYGHVEFDRDINLGVVEMVGEQLHNTALISLIANKTLRKEHIEFSFLESRPGKISLLVGGDDLKLAVKLLQDELD